MLVGLLFGSKILYAITVIPEVVEYFSLVKEYPIETFFYLIGGFVFYGGLIGSLLFLKMFTIQFDQPFWNYIGLFVPVIPLAHGFGRIGCFMAGCCYGMEYHGPFCVNYPENAIVED
jgi:phosphatidylglycerol:prolipoprotein diacylglycerol transferase